MPVTSDTLPHLHDGDIGLQGRGGLRRLHSTRAGHARLHVRHHTWQVGAAGWAVLRATYMAFNRFMVAQVCSQEQQYRRVVIAPALLQRQTQAASASTEECAEVQYCCCMGYRPVCSIPVWPHTCHPRPQGQFSFSAMCAGLCLMQHGVGFAPQVGRVSTPTWDSKSDQEIGVRDLSPRVQLRWSGSNSCHDSRCCSVQLFLGSPWGARADRCLGKPRWRDEVRR